MVARIAQRIGTRDTQREAVKLLTPRPDESTIQNVLEPDPLYERIELALMRSDVPPLNLGLPPLLMNIFTVRRHSFFSRKL